jgi:hypothetical protein
MTDRHHTPSQPQDDDQDPTMTALGIALAAVRGDTDTALLLLNDLHDLDTARAVAERLAACLQGTVRALVPAELIETFVDSMRRSTVAAHARR